jgi:dTDP-4-dehydrorhamnose 3,5-epimerase-like enzyme
MLIEQILPNCALHQHPAAQDARGSLIALEAGRDVPFAIERVYYLFDMAPGAARGFHAHRTLHQWAICVAGSCTMVVDDANRRCSIKLDSPDKALHIGPGVWREMRDFSPGAVLMVLASQPYDEADYIRDFDDFVANRRVDRPS